MSIYGEFQVTGNRAYRGHRPGVTFEAVIARNAVARAIGRGDIRLIQEITPRLQPGSYQFPLGWLSGPNQSSQPRRRKAPLS